MILPSMVSETLFLFLKKYYFFVLFWLYNFICLQVHWLLCHTAIVSTGRFSILVIAFFSSKVLILLWLFYLLRLSSFPLFFRGEIFILTCWSIFITAASKSISGNSNICVTLAVTSIDCLFSLELRFSWLFLCQIIFSGIFNFKYYSIRFLILPKFYVKCWSLCFLGSQLG